MGNDALARRVLSAVLSVLMLVVLAGVAGAAEGDTKAQLEQTQDELRRAQQNLAMTEQDVGDARAALQSVDAQLVVLHGQLAALEADLDASKGEYDVARNRTAEATQKLIEETDRLEQINGALGRRSDQFDHRTRATYKYGGVSYIDTLLGAEDFTDFLNTFYYVRSVLDHERNIITDIEDLAANVAERRRKVDQLRDERKHEEVLAARARDAVQTATDRQLQVTTQMESESAKRTELLNRLEGDQSHYEALVRQLDAESERLAEELRKSSWRAGAPGAGELVWPTNGRMGSGYGWRVHPIYGTRRFHSGVDIAGPAGQTIVSAADGRVVSAGWRGGYGLAVVIDHGGNLATLYAHQSRIVVQAGEVVSAGQKIGEVGTTGQSTGNHLHFEVRVNGETRDPMDWY